MALATVAGAQRSGFRTELVCELVAPITHGDGRLALARQRLEDAVCAFVDPIPSG